MPLRDSKKLPKEPVSYRRELGRHLKILLTGGLLAVGLAVAALVGYFRQPIVVPGPDGPLFELQLSGWVVLNVLFGVVCWVQYRMWADLRDQLHELAKPFYRFHPSTDEGIDVHLVQIRGPIGPPGSRIGPRKHLSVSLVLEKVRSRQLFVTCDGPFSRAELESELRPGGRQRGSAARGTLVPRPKEFGELISPTSFRISIPPSGPRLTLKVYGEDPPAVVAIEWLEGN